MKIMLIRPDYQEYQISNRSLGTIHQPIGLLYLAASLEQDGHEVIICDEMVRDNSSYLLRQEKPDMVLVHGDTTTSMTSSLAAFYHKTPVGHIEAGLRSHDKYAPFPEEVNRRITGTIAELHFTPTRESQQNLLRIEYILLPNP